MCVQALICEEPSGEEVSTQCFSVNERTNNLVYLQGKQGHLS